MPQSQVPEQEPSGLGLEGVGTSGVCSWGLMEGGGGMQGTHERRTGGVQCTASTTNGVSAHGRPTLLFQHSRPQRITWSW